KISEGDFSCVKPLKPRDPNLFDIWVKYWRNQTSNVQRPTPNVQRPTPNIQRPMQNVDSAVRCSAFDVRCSMFASCNVQHEAQSRIDYDYEHEHELATASPSAGGHDSCDIRSLRGSNPQPLP